MPSPARQRILDAALALIRERGIGRVTTKEIAVAAGAAEGSLFKNFGDKMGLLTELLTLELPENRAWRAVPAEAPPGQGDLTAALVLFMERAIDFYAAVLPLVAGSFADRELLHRQQERNRERGTGPQLAFSGLRRLLARLAAVRAPRRGSRSLRDRRRAVRRRPHVRLDRAARRGRASPGRPRRPHPRPHRQRGWAVHDQKRPVVPIHYPSPASRTRTALRHESPAPRGRLTHPAWAGPVAPASRAGPASGRRRWQGPAAAPALRSRCSHPAAIRSARRW